MAKYIFIAIFIVVFILFDNRLGFSKNSDWYTHFTYMFQHAGIFHLVINSIAYWGMFRMLEKLTNKYIIFFLPVACAIAASYFSMQETVTVGASALVYSMIGIFFGLVAFDKGVEIADKKKFYLFITCVAIGLVSSYFRANSNFLVHLVSMFWGFLSTFLVWLHDGDKLLCK